MVTVFLLPIKTTRLSTRLRSSLTFPGQLCSLNAANTWGSKSFMGLPYVGYLSVEMFD